MIFAREGPLQIGSRKMASQSCATVFGFRLLGAGKAPLPHATCEPQGRLCPASRAQSGSGKEQGTIGVGAGSDGGEAAPMMRQQQLLSSAFAPTLTRPFAALSLPGRAWPWPAVALAGGAVGRPRAACATGEATWRMGSACGVKGGGRGALQQRGALKRGCLAGRGGAVFVRGGVRGSAAGHGGGVRVRVRVGAASAGGRRLGARGGGGPPPRRARRRGR